jgi:hypothetical protein
MLTMVAVAFKVAGTTRNYGICNYRICNYGICIYRISNYGISNYGNQ